MKEIKILKQNTAHHFTLFLGTFISGYAWSAIKITKVFDNTNHDNYYVVILLILNHQICLN